jgi:peroxiredoxin
MKHRSPGLCLLAFLCLFVAFGCKGGESLPRVGDPSPRIELNDLKGNKVAVQDDARGKIVIIRFWGDCCSFNIHEMSRVAEIYRKYEEKGVRVVTIHTGGPKIVAETFASMLKIEFPVLLDSDSKIAKRYGALRTPCTFILDRDGVIRAKISGVVDGPIGPTYENIITPLLNGDPGERRR